MGPIIKPFNGTYFICWCIAVLAMIVIPLLLKNKSEKAKKTFLVGLCVVNIIVFFVYKGFLSVDRDFLAKAEIEGGFNWFNELPLQLCNINMFLIPIGLLTKKRGILGFSCVPRARLPKRAIIYAENTWLLRHPFLDCNGRYIARYARLLPPEIQGFAEGFFNPYRRFVLHSPCQFIVKGNRYLQLC